MPTCTTQGCSCSGQLPGVTVHVQAGVWVVSMQLLLMKISYISQADLCDSILKYCINFPGDKSANVTEVQVKEITHKVKNVLKIFWQGASFSKIKLYFTFGKAEYMLSTVTAARDEQCRPGRSGNYPEEWGWVTDLKSNHKLASKLISIRELSKHQEWVGNQVLDELTFRDGFCADRIVSFYHN